MLQRDAAELGPIGAGQEGPHQRTLRVGIEDSLEDDRIDDLHDVEAESLIDGQVADDVGDRQVAPDMLKREHVPVRILGKHLDVVETAAGTDVETGVRRQETHEPPDRGGIELTPSRPRFAIAY